jgi:hypothetical protein
MAGFWTRLEDWILELQRDRVRMARYFQVAYWISVAFVALGAVLILLVYSGAWKP